jgi:hypothetical protein
MSGGINGMLHKVQTKNVEEIIISESKQGFRIKSERIPSRKIFSVQIYTLSCIILG